MSWNLIPSSLVNPLKLIIQGMELTYLSGHPRSGESIRANPTERFEIMAPNDIIETVTHTWSEYESIATRVSQLFATGRSATGQTSHAAKSIRSAKLPNLTPSGITNSLVGLGLDAGAGDLSSILNHRVDSPLVYKNSERRQYTLTFQLAEYDNSVTCEYIYECIKRLQQLSCPVMRGGANLLDFPNIFSLHTSPSNIISLKHAVLEAVQPTWKSPFKNGYSMEVDLQLTFKEFDPLYRDNIVTNARGI